MNAIHDTPELAPVQRAARGIGAADRFKMLLKREFWENRGGFVWAPIITGAIATLFALIGAIGGTVALQKAKAEGHFDAQIHLDAGESHPVAAAADLVLLGGMSIAIIVMVFVVFFYLLGSLYDERRDRSVLFWKSLPVADTETVLSKLAWAVVLAPLFAIGIGIGIGLILWIVLGVSAFLNGIPGASTAMFTDSQPFRLILQVLSVIPVYTAWSLPTVGWLMLCSAWAKRFPFLWAVLLPVLGCALISLSGGIFGAISGLDFPFEQLWYVVVYRGLMSLIPGTWYARIGVDDDLQIDGPQNLADHFDVSGSWAVFTTLDMWLGITFGVAMIVLAIRLRRWRDEG